MTMGDYNTFRGWTILDDENPEDEGYLVKYPDGYISWSPKQIFEKAYLQVDDNKNLPSGVSIGRDMVDDFIAYYETHTMGEDTTVAAVFFGMDSQSLNLLLASIRQTIPKRWEKRSA